MEAKLKKTGSFVLTFILVLLTNLAVLFSQQVQDVTGEAGTLSQKEEVVGEIRGRILDYETKAPLVGVSVSIVGLKKTSESDENGYYSLTRIPIGYYAVNFTIDGYYEDTRTNIIVSSGKATVLNIQLLTVRIVAEEVDVTAEYFSKTRGRTGSQVQIENEELRRNAGSAGDVSRALYSTPGILKADEESNDLIVRGGSPVENGFYLDNIFVPNINHFPQWGASGGNISMLNMDFIDRINIFTGGYDASYGNRLSSIIDIAYREGDRESLEGQLNLSILGYGAQIEGPLPGRKGSWMISANQSYLNLIRGAIGNDAYPSYNDIQGKIHFDLNPNNSFTLLTIVGSSQTEEDRDEARQLDILTYDREKFDTATVGLNWRRLWGGIGYSDTSVSYSFLNGREDEWEVSDNDLVDNFGYRNSWVTLRNVNNINLSDSHQLKFGFEGQNVQFLYFDSDVEEDNKFGGTFGAAFLTYTVYPFSTFSLSAGARLDYFPFSERLHLSPRISFSWTLTERLAVTGAYGLYIQQMPLFLLQQDPDNIQLQDLKSRHMILGFRYLLRNDTQLTLEFYDKLYTNFPMSVFAPYFFVIDDLTGDDAKFGNWGPLVDEGKAYARGIEFSIQKKLLKNFYGLVNLTYYRARYRDLMGVWRNRLYDNRFIFCLSGGYKPNKNWEISARWTWGGNKAFTPVNEQKSIQYGFPWVDLEDIMAGHLDNYNNLSEKACQWFH